MRDSKPAEPRRATWSSRRTASWLGIFLLACLPALLDPGAIQRAASLEDLARGEHPYFVPAHFGLLYLWAPLVVLSGCFFFLAPGLLLAWALGAAGDFGRWVLYGLGLSLIVVSVAAALVQTLLGHPLVGTSFSLVVLACIALCALILWIRNARGSDVACWLDQPGRLRLLAPVVIAPWLLIACFAPKFFWEGFNGDGVHAYEATRLLLTRALPFWDKEAGPIAFYPGVTTMLFAFPGSWFLRMFGLVEASARVPVILYLVGAFAGIVAIAEQKRGSIPAIDAALIWLGLALYFVTMAFSASYDPYSADIALPATQDTLLMACMLGMVLAWSRNERAWTLFFLFLTFISLPSGILLILMFVAASWLFTRPRPWKKIAWAAAGLAACVVFSALLPKALAAFDLPLPGTEYARESMLERFAFLQFTDTQRFLFVLLPCGIIPVFAFFSWGKLDPLGRALALVTLGYFALFYVQAHVSLHHFVPAMILPLAVFWRSDMADASGRRRWVLGNLAFAGLAGIILVLPDDGTVAMQGKDIGKLIDVRVPGYEQSAPEPFLAAGTIGKLFSTGIDPEVPDQRFGGSPYILNFYAQRARGTEREVNYVVQRAQEVAPEGMSRVAEQDGTALYVRDLALWERQKALKPPTPAGSSLLAIDRGLMFGQKPRGKQIFILNVRSFLRRMGL